MARKFAVVGLSTFGYQLACELQELGGEVLAVDSDPKIIEQIRDKVAQAIECDALDRESLQELNLGDVDAVIIGLRSRLDVSILTTMMLKEEGVPEIVALAISEDHSRALQKVGATRVVFPEKDIAIRTASHLMTPNLIDYLWAGSDYGLVEVSMPESFVGKTLVELNVRKRHGVTVVAVRHDEKGEEGEPVPPFVPKPDYVFQKNDILLVIGSNENINKFPS